MIQLFSNSLGEEEVQAVEKVFYGKWLGYGNECKLFEKEFAEKIKSENILMTNCGTSALFISINLLGIGNGDEVIIPSINFIGCATAICSVGAKPIFADVDINTLNILPEEIIRLRTSRTKAVLLLHYGGHPSKMDEIQEICSKYGIYIIEDSANSIVSKYKGKNCGTMGDVGCFSFDAMKILCCGDGGAISIQNKNYVEQAKRIRYFGIVNRESGFESVSKNYNEWWKIEMADISNRYVPNDIAGTIARCQLKKLDSFIERRKEIWDMYQKGLRGKSGIILPPEPLEDCTSSYYLYWIRSENRNYLARKLIENGIYCSFRYYPLHLIDYFKKIIGYSKLNNSEIVASTTINLPLHQNLTDQEVEFIIDKIKSYPL